MNASMLLPGDIDAGVQAFLAGALANVNVGSIGDLELDDNGQLIFDPPCVRTRYAAGKYEGGGDNLALTYDNSHHYVDLWCAAENLQSSTAQRGDTLTLVGQVLASGLVGQKITLPSDGTVSEPVRLLGVSSLQDDPAGTVYVISIDVPGVAQFPYGGG